MDRQEPPKTPQNGQPPVPPPKKDKEFNFGKNLLGILASLLVFIGILLTAWASGSRWIQLCGILGSRLVSDAARHAGFPQEVGIPDVFSVRFRLRCGNPVSGHYAGLLVL